jgi:hypothetical protein
MPMTKTERTIAGFPSKSHISCHKTDAEMDCKQEMWPVHRFIPPPTISQDGSIWRLQIGKITQVFKVAVLFCLLTEMVDGVFLPHSPAYPLSNLDELIAFPLLLK